MIDVVFSRRSLPCIMPFCLAWLRQYLSIHVLIYSCLASIPFCALGSQLVLILMHGRLRLSVLDI
jgi:hypothetical protein